MSYTTWESACEAAIEHVLGGDAGNVFVTVGDCEQYMRFAIDQAIGAGDDGLTVEWLQGLAVAAWRWMQVDGYDIPTVGWMVRKLAEKQANYGTGNILKFGVNGLTVRCSDKVERVSNMRAHGRRNTDESVWDSLFDLIGYAAIGHMLEAGTFELPLYRDTDEGKVGAWVDAVTADEEARALAWVERMREVIPEGYPPDAFNRLLGQLMNSGLDPHDHRNQLHWQGL